MSWLGLDIGGANLKAADGRGWARSVPFALWRTPNDLSKSTANLIQAAPDAKQLAVTMTGELADCFRTKAEGVRHIVSAVDAAAAGRPILVYLVDGRLVSIEKACDLPQLAAASNWRALAEIACRFVEAWPAALIDVGSTTTDITPLKDGRPCPHGMNDTERLLSRELVYTGVGRTPICAVARALPWRGVMCPVAAEVFATTADAYVILGNLPEQLQATDTADGRALTKQFARERLARIICADATTFSDDDAAVAADHVRQCQSALLHEALCKVAGDAGARFETIIVSGQGEFIPLRLLSQRFPERRVILLSETLGEQASRCAPAHAVAVLAREGVERS